VINITLNNPTPEEVDALRDIFQISESDFLECEAVDELRADMAKLQQDLKNMPVKLFDPIYEIAKKRAEDDTKIQKKDRPTKTHRQD
jgi:hypothetical protein